MTVRRRVLLVDDNDDDRRLTSRLLRRDARIEYEIIEHRTADGVEDLVREQKPDVIILDQHLGTATGTELFGRLQDLQLTHVPVIFITGSSPRYGPVDPIVMGADDFITKEDLSAGVLQRIVDNAITRAQTRVALERSREQLDAAVEELTRRVAFEGRLIGVVSHDLRDPLNAMSMAVATLSDRPLDAQSKRIVAILERSTRHMSSMVSQLLDVTRVRQNSRFPVTFGPTEIGELAEQAVAAASSSDPSARFLVDVRADASCQADPTAVLQALGNLLGNAVRHGDMSRPVEVAITRDGDFIAIEVRNFGAPIPADRVSTLFEPFTQAGDDKARRGRGLGLGLYITNEIAKAHGGHLQVASSEEEGTVFTLRIHAAQTSQPEPS